MTPALDKEFYVIEARKSSRMQMWTPEKLWLFTVP